MSSIDDILNNASIDTLDHLGRAVFVNGIKLKCIINDDQYEDETGYRREVSLSFNKKDAPYLSVGQPVFIKGTNYLIRITEL